MKRLHPSTSYCSSKKQKAWYQVSCGKEYSSIAGWTGCVDPFSTYRCYQEVLDKYDSWKFNALSLPELQCFNLASSFYTSKTPCTSAFSSRVPLVHLLDDLLLLYRKANDAKTSLSLYRPQSFSDFPLSVYFDEALTQALFVNRLAYECFTIHNFLSTMAKTCLFVELEFVEWNVDALY